MAGKTGAYRRVDGVRVDDFGEDDVGEDGGGEDDAGDSDLTVRGGHAACRPGTRGRAPRRSRRLLRPAVHGARFQRSPARIRRSRGDRSWRTSRWPTSATTK
jgi:hypothetical protein